MAEFSDRNSCDALKSVGERSELSRRDSQFCGEISKVGIPLNSDQLLVQWNYSAQCPQNCNTSILFA